LSRSPKSVLFAVALATTACAADEPHSANIDTVGEELRRAPGLESVTPGVGPTAGGTTVTLHGRNFRSTSKVYFDGVDATGIEFVSSTELRARTPAHAAGSVDVAVANAARSAAKLADAFTYDDGSEPALPPTTTRALTLGTPDLKVLPGDSATLAMRFDALPMAKDYHVFVHFVNASGAQATFAGDHWPSTPTSSWSGSVSYDHAVTIPGDAPLGVYSIRIGLYDYVPPYDHRIPLESGPGVTVDDQLRYTVGQLTIATDGTTSTPPATPPSTPPTSSPTGPAGQNAGDYVLSFDEEFDALDTSRWNDHIWYESSNPTINYAVENGALKIWPQRDGSGNFFNRTLDTDGHYYQTYGFFEMEAKLPRGRGTWPAFWLFNHVGDQHFPELDIMEAYPGGEGWGSDGPNGVRIPVAYGATIWADANVLVGTNMHQTPDLSAAMHTYGLKWEPNKVTFFFDGNAFYSANVTMGDPMYILLDLWFGSASGQPDDTTPTGKSNSYEVNYVRAWKFK
jgi:beta-glucanase (GH16 family)